MIWKYFLLDMSLFGTNFNHFQVWLFRILCLLFEADFSIYLFIICHQQIDNIWDKTILTYVYKDPI